MESKTKSCFMYGCIGLLVIGLIIGGVIFATTYSFYKKVKSYTAEKPLEIPVYQYTEQEKQEVTDKVEKLKQAFENEESIEIKFSGNDLNTLIACHPEADKLAGKVSIDIQGDQIKALGSVPLTEVPLFSDRFLNGSFSLKINMKNNRLHITAESLQVDGKNVPDEFMTQLKNKDLAMELYNDPKKADFLNKLQNVEVKDNHLLVETKGQ